jgi:tetratricopeptide (TPR) repeat protein
MVECYFERAIRFVPDDPMPYVIYANYLKDRGRIPEAREALHRAEERRGDPSTYDLDYNLGILYANLGEMDRAAVAGRRAYDLGAPLPGLKSKLVAAGKWREPSEKTAQRAKAPEETPAVAPPIGP